MCEPAAVDLRRMCWQHPRQSTSMSHLVASFAWPLFAAIQTVACRTQGFAHQIVPHCTSWPPCCNSQSSATVASHRGHNRTRRHSLLWTVSLWKGRRYSNLGSSCCTQSCLPEREVFVVSLRLLIETFLHLLHQKLADLIVVQILN